MLGVNELAAPETSKFKVPVPPVTLLSLEIIQIDQNLDPVDHHGYAVTTNALHKLLQWTFQLH